MFLIKICYYGFIIQKKSKIIERKHHLYLGHYLFITAQVGVAGHRLCDLHIR